MIPTAFDEDNAVIGPPLGMRPNDVETISVWQGELESGTPVVISCWKLTDRELAEVIKTGRVWLMVMGETMQPSVVEGVSPFKHSY